MKLCKLLLILMLFMSTSVHALRCGNKLLLEGDDVYTMIQLCGEPAGYLRDVSIRGDRVVYIYKMDRKIVRIYTRDNIIERIR